MTCPHNMPSPASCWECMEDGAVVEPARWQRVGDPFRARYDAECGCGQPIVAGASRVQRWDLGDARTVYRHDDCGPPSR